MLPFLAKKDKFISSSVIESATAQTSGSVFKPTGVSPGNLLILLIFAVEVSSTSVSYTYTHDFGGNTFFCPQLQTGGDGSNQWTFVGISTKVASGSEPTSYGFTFTGGNAASYRAVVLNLSPVTTPTLSQLQNPLIDTSAPTIYHTSDSPVTTLTQKASGGSLVSVTGGYELLVTMGASEALQQPSVGTSIISSGVSNMVGVTVGSMFNGNLTAMQVWVKPSASETLNNVALVIPDVFPEGVSLNGALWYLGA